MSDWLGKLEAFHKMARRNNELEGAVGYPETPGERMARVLREMARYIKANHAIEESVLTPNSNKDGLLLEVQSSWREMSDDAKGLIDQERKA